MIINKDLIRGYKVNKVLNLIRNRTIYAIKELSKVNRYMQIYDLNKRQSSVNMNDDQRN